MTTAFDQLPETTRDQMACVYSTLLLHDDGQEVSEENLNKVLKAAGLSVAPYWPSLFINAIGDKPIDSLLSVGGGAAPAGGAAAGGAPAPAAAAEKKEDAPAEEENVSMGGLFD